MLEEVETGMFVSTRMYQHMAIWVFMLLLQLSSQMQIRRFAMTMPDVSPDKPEQYLCTPVKVSSIILFTIDCAAEPLNVDDFFKQFVLFFSDR